MVRNPLSVLSEVFFGEGSSARYALRQFPAVLNCSTVNHFHAWPEDALLKVAETFLPRLQRGDKPDEAVAESARSQVVVQRDCSAHPTNLLPVQLLYLGTAASQLWLY